MYSKEEQRRLYDLSKGFLKDDIIAKHEVTEGGNASEAATKVADLQQLLRYHEWRYYILDDPQISDHEYDMLYKKLEALEDLFPELQTPDSPTMRVGDDRVSDSPTVAHLTPMLSLENSYNADDLNGFDEHIIFMVTDLRVV